MSGPGLNVPLGDPRLPALRRLRPPAFLLLCVGILDIVSDRGPTRAVGELAGVPDPALGLPTITGFENHGGRTHLAAGLTPLARVTAGVGNDGTSEGVWHGKLIGTYMHGPALARNPALPGMWVAVGLVAGGALGNLADRLRDGSVTDYVEFGSWPPFNLADVAIVAGVSLFAVIFIRDGAKRDHSRR